MIHIDLFSGIGGFSLAVDQLWPDAEHIFCEIDPFCKQILKKHWPGSKIYSDIKKLNYDRIITDTDKRGHIHGESKKHPPERHDETQRQPFSGTRPPRIHLITGGFPCQPFSAAGKRKGTEDDRHLWPEMYRVIKECRPTYVLAENVRGILNIEGGVVFEQVCADLEAIGYEVQPFVIPACAVNAPHRRDRIWIAAHAKSERNRGGASKKCGISKREFQQEEPKRGEVWSESKRCPGYAADTDTRGVRRHERESAQERPTSCSSPSWDENWTEVATELCGMADGLPAELDGFELSKAKHRAERLKSLGNAIVPQVAYEILKVMKNIEND